MPSNAWFIGRSTNAAAEKHGLSRRLFSQSREWLNWLCTAGAAPALSGRTVRCIGDAPVHVLGSTTHARNIG